MSDIFHAYIIGGDKEQARGEVEVLLRDIGLSKTDPNVTISEHVTFTIDDARILTEWQSMRSQGSAKAYICYTDFITREAQNALLKTFEEPVPGTHVILCVPNPGILLDTLLSRVRVRMSSETDGDTGTAQKFLDAPIAKRLLIVTKMLGKDEDDPNASAIVRERALSFIGELEILLSVDATRNAGILATLLDLKKYLYIPGASVRIILETLALTV